MLIGARGPTRAGAFESLFREMAPAVRRFAARRVGSDLADDVVSETFSVVWRRWDDLPDEQHFRRAWVFRVAHHTVSHTMRSRSRVQRLAARVQQAPVHVPDVAEDLAGDDRVSQLLAHLPPREREAMSLVVWDGLSAGQAAYVLGCSATAISSRLTRARRRLEKVIAADGVVSREEVTR